QLRSEFHRDLVVGDEQELGLVRHAADDLDIALGVGLIERRIDLVEQAERRRIELEEREYQGDRGERLLAARELVDRAVALARRLRHHLDAGIEDFVAGQYEARFPAAEELREQHAEMTIDGVVGVLQQLAGLAVDTSDGVLERL